MFQHAGAAALRQRYGIIATARIDHDGLRRKGHGCKAIRKLEGGVAGDDDERQGKRFGHSRQGGVRRKRGARAGILVLRRILRGLPRCAMRRSDPRSIGMSGLLVVRPSSLGDVVHALALIGDVTAHDPAMPVDWVAEEAFVPLVRLDARIRNVVPMAFRRWRDAPFAARTWREFRGFRRALRRDDYAVVLDLQEQVKGAIVTRMARGRRHGFDRQSIREPLATWFDDVHHRIARDQHFIDKSRALAAAAFGYRVEGPPRWQFTPPAAAADHAGVPSMRCVFHATSRGDKLWPEERWRALLAHFARAGLTTIVALGKRSRRRAQPTVDRRNRRTPWCRRGRRCRNSPSLARNAPGRGRRRHRPHASGRGDGHTDRRHLHGDRSRARRRGAGRCACAGCRRQWARPFVRRGCVGRDGHVSRGAPRC